MPRPLVLIVVGPAAPLFTEVVRGHRHAPPRPRTRLPGRAGPR
jgi:hypothetical protein